MSRASADLMQPSRIAEAAAFYLRDLNYGNAAASDVRAVADALEIAVLSLRRVAFAIENSRGLEE